MWILIVGWVEATKPNSTRHWYLVFSTETGFLLLLCY